MNHQPMRVPGPGGLDWTHRVETLAIRSTLSPEAVMYEDKPDFLQHSAREAARRLLDHLIHEAATHHRTELPNGGADHVWHVSVVMPDDNRNWFADQMEREREEGRREGITAATKLARKHAESMAKVDAPNAGIIAFNLKRLAEELARM